uniref:Interleukin-7 n=2 Tax=Rattus norvegicus TaxID=10116 RepID=F7FJK6_RAT
IFHTFSFRYIFGIPPLILVLLPVTSSDCHIKDKDGKAFGSVLMISINQLDKMTGTDSDCPNNEPNFFKKHLCDDTKEAAFLNRAARKLRQFLKMNISEEFNDHLLRVSDGTQTLVNCTSKEEKTIKEQKKNDPCFLKRLLREIKTCWNKILNSSI